MKTNYIATRRIHIPKIKVGDMITVTIHADAVTTLYNSHRITNIQTNGILRVECINKNCTKKACTYLMLSESEIRSIKIDNTIKESKRLGGMSIY